MNAPRTTWTMWTMVWMLLASGCAPAALGPVDPTRQRREPDGVAIDLASSTPPSRERASASDGVVTLRSPLGSNLAISLLEDLFRRVVVEDGEGVANLFTRDSLSLQPGMAPQQGTNAALFWQTRFKKLDYTRLAGEPIFRETEVSIFRPSDGVETVPHPAIRPDALADGDVVLRVPIVTTRVGADRFFGDDIVFWLRPAGDHYLIYRVLEDFQLN